MGQPNTIQHWTGDSSVKGTKDTWMPQPSRLIATEGFNAKSAVIGVTGFIVHREKLGGSCSLPNRGVSSGCLKGLLGASASTFVPGILLRNKNNRILFFVLEPSISKLRT